jgi:hypothetical protein
VYHLTEAVEEMPAASLRNRVPSGVFLSSLRRLFITRIHGDMNANYTTEYTKSGSRFQYVEIRIFVECLTLLKENTYTEHADTGLSIHTHHIDHFTAYVVGTRTQ